MDVQDQVPSYQYLDSRMREVWTTSCGVASRSDEAAVEYFIVVASWFPRGADKPRYITRRDPGGSKFVALPWEYDFERNEVSVLGFADARRS